MGFNQLILPLFLQMVITAVMLPSSTPILASPSFPIAKPGCEDSCGTVSIPFPFGTKEGCYLDEGFFINCTYSSDKTPRAFLDSSTINVIDIFLEGQLRLLDYVGYDCYDRNGSSKPDYYFSPWMELSHEYTFNSTTNKFTTVGCDTFGEVEGFSDSRQYTTGCVSFCDFKQDVIDGSCAGIGCCQTSIPPGAWRINVTLTSTNNHIDVWDFNNCSYAFVVEDGAFHFHADNLTNLGQDAQLPVLVDWTIPNATCEDAQKNTTSYTCFTNSECYEPDPNVSGYRCRCLEGYEGNPYLPYGCQDTNECLDSNLHKCATNSACINTLGSYTCPCRKGYHGDGRSEDGCTPDENHKGTKRWIIIVSGVGIGTAILLLGGFCLYLECKRRKEDRMKEEFFRQNGGLILQQRLAAQGVETNGARIFSLEELQRATNDFDESRIIGRGGYGIVFKGDLADNSIVAIKKSKGVDQNQVEQFINEFIVLSRINDRNVVRLKGCCLETPAPLLVYEFISNGTLSEHLHNQTKAAKLLWNIRIRIASEIARVLSYMHSTASPPIVHRDIKSANILLDQDYTAKVSDFGISKLVPLEENQVSTVVQGTPGYLDPEYLQTGLLTEKSDVYSYGVVLIELLTGKKVVSLEKPEAERFLANHFISSFREGNLVQVLDRYIVCNQSIELLKEVAEIAKCCLSVKGEDRPSMKNIARQLDLLEIRAEQSPVQLVFEVDSTDAEALLTMQSTNAYVSSNDSSGFYAVSTHTMTENMMLPIAGGR